MAQVRLSTDKNQETSEALSKGASNSLETASLRVEESAPGRESEEWAKVRAIAIRQLDRFISLEPKVLRGDPDAIHDMRVASRRLQQVLDLLCPSPDREIRRFRRRVRRGRRTLSDVRNCDVLIQRLEKSLSSKRTSRRETWEAVRDYLYQRRAQNYDKALRKLSKVNVALLYVNLKRHLVRNGAGPDHGPSAPRAADSDGLASAQFYERVSETLEKVWQDFETQVAESRRNSQATALHRVRITAKRLRYLIEVIREFNVPGSRDVVAWLRRLQQHLGDWHDLEVLEQLMTEMVARPKYLRDHLDIAAGVMKLIARNRAAKRTYQEKYFSLVLDSAGYPRLKEWVGNLLSSPSAALGDSGSGEQKAVSRRQ